jgi:protein kinase
MITEGAKLVGESGKTYLAVGPLGQSNVWTAVEQSDDPKKPVQVVVIKEPGEIDTKPGWPSFQNEMVMHEIFKDSPAIRQQIDRIPPTSSGGPPMIVLEITETTLWAARTKRPMTLAEIKTVAKDVLVGLRDVHDKGLVYADLKPQNIMVDGFDADSEEKDNNLHATLGDLGLVMEPMNGTVQPITYRAPEVFLKGDITSRVDVWSWGLIYCHLLEARNQFSETGMYDSLGTKNGLLSEQEAAVKTALTNDYKLQNDPVYGGVPLPQNDPSKHKGDQWEVLRQRGLEDGEVDFLRWVLKADPYQRPTVNQILECGWLDKTAEQVASGFTPPQFEHLEYDPKRATPEEFAAQEKQEASNNNSPGQYFPNVSANQTQSRQTSRPVMADKRYHSEEDEVPVKRMYVPDAKLMAPAEQPKQQQQQAQSTPFTHPSQPMDTSSKATPTPFIDVGTIDQTSAFVAPFGSSGSNGAGQSNVNTANKGVDASKNTNTTTTTRPFGIATPGADASVPVPFTTYEQPSSSSSTTTTTTTTKQQRPALSTKNTGTFLSYK